MVYTMDSKSIGRKALRVQIPPLVQMKELKLNENDLKRIFIADTPMARFWKAAKRLTGQLLSVAALYFLFFVILNFGAYWARFQYSVNASPIPEPTPTVVVQPKPTIQYKPEVIISKIGVKAPLIVDIDPELIVAKLKNGVVQYANSAKPGQIGNMVIVGHSSDFPWSNGKYKNVFALLDKLTVGDKITVPYGSEKYVYAVTSSKVVKPTDLSVLKKTNTPTLTLLTCYPVGTTRSRLIVIAQLVSKNAAGEQTTDPLTGGSLPRPR